MAMELAKKLQIPSDMAIYVVNPPKELKLDELKISKKSDPSVAVLVFAENSKVLATNAVKPVIEAARADRLSWIAYPKAGQLETDLNRDKLVALLKSYGIEGVRLVSIDNVWSAMRFRPIGKRKRS